MDEKSLRILEYDKIADMLRSHAASGLARERLGGLRPLGDAETVRERLEETGAAVELIREEGNPPLGNIHDISFISLTRKGGSLTPGELLKVAANIETSAAMKKYLGGRAFADRAEVLEDHRRLLSEIRRCVITGDEIADSASPALRAIRRDMARKHAAVRSRLEAIITSEGYRNILQDAIVTLRDGRYVIPVKQEYRHSFPGLIHDQSGSGATLFIEPQAVVELNNDLKEMELEERKEIARRLKSLSELTAENYHGLINDMRILTDLDVIFARGRFALSYNGSMPEMNEAGILDLREARHPLIDAETVVPVSVSLGREHKALIITGPNTGGKTVTLKTCGLLSAMAQSGMFIPAAEGSRVPIYGDIFADIGDEQSIEQSLSTFSSHMRNIVAITEKADSSSLVLLDELGAGTDPAEGAALAIAVIEELMGRGACIMATTHYTELKKYAVSRQGVENASMEFDIDTLSPTYRLITGMPGRSNAFEISRKLGLDENIVRAAGDLLRNGDIEFEDVLAALEEDRKRAEEDRRTAAGLVAAAKKRKAELERREKELDEKRDEILRRAREEARNIVREAGETVREVQKDISRDPGTANVIRGRERLKEIERKNTVSAVIRNDAPVDADSLRPGDRVRIVSLGKDGVLLEPPDERGNCRVRCGQMKVKVKVDDLSRTSSGKTGKRQPQPYEGGFSDKRKSISLSKSVIGENLDDAVFIIGKYLDDASLAGLREVTVIHGRGEGVLRKGLREMFRTHRHVSSFRPGTYSEGGDGVTVVTLK